MWLGMILLWTINSIHQLNCKARFSWSITLITGRIILQVAEFIVTFDTSDNDYKFSFEIVYVLDGFIH